jgi:hypothetical protein
MCRYFAAMLKYCDMQWLRENFIGFDYIFV